MRMKGITLFFLGGVAEMEDEPPTPWAEFTMAIVGPIASVVIGGTLTVVGNAASGAAAPGIWLRNSGLNSPNTVETLTPTFSNTRPCMMDITPPPLSLSSPVDGILFTLRDYPLVYEGSLMARVMARKVGQA